MSRGESRVSHSGGEPTGPWLRFVRAAYARGYVRIVGSFREPVWLIADAVLPAVGMCAFVLLYRALGAPPSFEALAMLGGILATFWLNVVWGMGTQLYWEKQSGQLQLYFVSPVPRMAILAGMAVGGLLATLLRSAFGLLLGIGVLGVRIPPFDAGMLALVFVVAMAALYALGMILSSAFLLFGREAWHVSNAVQEPVYFMSGLYFPLRTLGALGWGLAGLVPLGFGVDALRQVLLGPAARGLAPVPVETAILAAMAVVLFVVARFALDRLERLSKREGRLTQRWQ